MIEIYQKMFSAFLQMIIFSKMTKLDFKFLKLKLATLLNLNIFVGFLDFFRF